MASLAGWRVLSLRLLAALVVAWLVVGGALYVRLRRDVRELQASWVETPWEVPFAAGEGTWPTPLRWQHATGSGAVDAGGEGALTWTALTCAADDAEVLLGRYRRFLVAQGFTVRRPRPDRPALVAERDGASASVRIGRPTWMGTRELRLSAQGRLRVPGGADGPDGADGSR